MTLALDYRPQRFADIVGQTHIRPVLKAIVKTQKVPPALLFVGTRGTGKTTTARIFSAALNCEEQKDGDACAECASCRAIQDGLSLSVQEIDAASNGNVEDIREMKESLQYAHMGEWRVIMLDEAHSMSRNAFNALLKIFEEPPPQTVFILLTTEAHKILDTVVSRSMSFEFRRLTLGEIVGRLRHIATDQNIEADDELLFEIAERAQGGMRDAVMALDQASRIGIKDIHGYRELFGIRDMSRDLLEAAIAGDHTQGVALIEEYFEKVGDAAGMVNDLVSLIRDLLIVLSGGEPRAREPEASKRRDLTTRTDIDKLIGTIRILWEVKGRVRAVDNDQRAAMLMAFTLMVDAMRERAVVPIPSANGTVNGQAPKRLSLDDMRTMVEGPSGRQAPAT